MDIFNLDFNPWIISNLSNFQHLQIYSILDNLGGGSNLTLGNDAKLIANGKVYKWIFSKLLFLL